jgi:predicted ester cyclase
MMKPTPYDDVLARLSPGPQSMRGFDADYPDIVAYIIRCTYKIWEEKQLGLINSHYAVDSVIHTPAGDTVGAQAVLANTVQQLSMFPDRRLYPDDVIWSGDDEAGFYSSHRIVSTARHLGFGAFGQPSGKKLRYRVIADCLVKENKIVEEWLVRDNLSILQQIGLDAHRYAADLVAGWTPRALAAPQPGPGLAYTPAPESGSLAVAHFIQHAWHTAWNERRFDAFDQAYLSTVKVHSASGRELFGQAEVIQFVIDWLSCFPDGQMSFDHFCAVGSEAEGYRTALRWTLRGVHSGRGLYGEPSGKPVEIMGITHAQVQGGKILEEWTVFDELNILCQVFQPGNLEPR